MFRATEWEFRHRFFVVVALYAIAFGCSFFDPINAGEAVARVAGASGRVGMRVVFGLGALIAFVAAGLRTWAAAYIESGVVHDLELHSGTLVADGPYRCLRNPLYLGMILLGAALGLLASRLGAAVLVVGLVVFSLRLIGLEEARLLASQGDSFRDFRDRVPRLVPSILPRLPRSGRRPRWGQAVAGEGFYWAVAAGYAAFAATLRATVIETVAGAALAVYFLYQMTLRRERRPPAP